MDQLGGNTEDILALGQTHPAEQGMPAEDREQNTRRFGRRCFTIGVSLLAATYLAALIGAVLSGNHMWTNTAGQLFGVLGIVTATALGLGLVLIGGLERLNQHQRAVRRLALVGMEQMANAQAAQAHAIDVIAGHLPEALELHNWRGFNAAVKEGFAPSSTGTDGTNARRSQRLGLVPPRRNER